MPSKIFIIELQKVVLMFPNLISSGQLQIIFLKRQLNFCEWIWFQDPPYNLK